MVFAGASSVGAQVLNKKDPSFRELRLDRLNIMFDGNISGAVWAKHCHAKSLREYPRYILNAKLTKQFLGEEISHLDKRITAAKIEETLQRKQRDAEKALNDFYTKMGCNTSQALAASKHFDLFKDKDPAEMKEFLIDIQYR